MEAEERSRGTQRDAHRDTHLEIETERPRNRETQRQRETHSAGSRWKNKMPYRRDVGRDKNGKEIQRQKDIKTPRAGHRETQRGERGRHTCTSVNSDTCAKEETSAGRNRWQRQRDPD